MIEQLRALKEGDEIGCIEAEGLAITYNPHFEPSEDALTSTHGPWSIEGDTEHLSMSQVFMLSKALRLIEVVEEGKE